MNYYLTFTVRRCYFNCQRGFRGWTTLAHKHCWTGDNVSSAAFEVDILW